MLDVSTLVFGCRPISRAISSSFIRAMLRRLPPREEQDKSRDIKHTLFMCFSHDANINWLLIFNSSKMLVESEKYHQILKIT